MTPTAVLAGNEQRINFVNIYVRAEKAASEQGVPELSSKVKDQDTLLDWFEKSDLIIPIESKTIPAENIFQGDRLIIKFKLSDQYRDSFVLLRGLVEFSRPKAISISSNASEKTFEVNLSEGQAAAIIIYLDTILVWLLKEIKFKNSLKAVLRFEHAIAQQQSKLYKELLASVH